MIDDNQGESHSLTIRNINDYENYEIVNPSSQSVIESYTDNPNRDQLYHRLTVDCAIAVVTAQKIMFSIKDFFSKYHCGFGHIY